MANYHLSIEDAAIDKAVTFSLRADIGPARFHPSGVSCSCLCMVFPRRVKSRGPESLAHVSPSTPFGGNHATGKVSVCRFFARIRLHGSVIQPSWVAAYHPPPGPKKGSSLVQMSNLYDASGSFLNNLMGLTTAENQAFYGRLGPGLFGPEALSESYEFGSSD